MFDLFFESLAMLNLQIFLISILLFSIGYAMAPMVYHKDIRLLTAYPLWMTKKLERWTKKKWNPGLIFIFIFSANLLSLYLSFVSGTVPLLPIVFTIWTGLNIGIITFHTLKGRFYYAALLNPVALLELPAAFIAFSAALQLNLTRLQLDLFAIPSMEFSVYSSLFAATVIPLLFLAGILETVLIRFSQKFEEFKDE